MTDIHRQYKPDRQTDRHRDNRQKTKITLKLTDNAKIFAGGGSNV